MATSIVPFNLSNDKFQVFYFDECPIRIVLDDKGDPWFIAADICKALAISNPSMAVGRLDEDETTLISIEGYPNQVNIVSEPGLYSLIATSRKEAAKRFRRWVHHEVLPSIRKTGKYQFQEPSKLALIDQLHQITMEVLEDHEARIQTLESQTKQIVGENKDLSNQVDYWHDQADINYGIKK